MSSSRSALERATQLADAALDQPPGSALVCEHGREPATLSATPHRYGALVGLSCPPSIDSVAASHDVVLSVDGRHHDAVLGVAVLRAGPCVARVRRGRDDPRTLCRLVGPVLDIGRRALGLATPASTRRPLDLLDAAFADSVLSGLLGADLGSRRPRWAEISAGHPLADSRPMNAPDLRSRRLELAEIGWSDVRDRIIGQAGAADHEITPALARWLDDGSLARWLLARYPEPAQMIADICELLDPTSALSFRIAHDMTSATSR